MYSSAAVRGVMWPVWMPCRRRLTQLAVGRRGRTVWVVFATLMLFAFLYTHYSASHLHDTRHVQIASNDANSKIVVVAVEYDEIGDVINDDDYDDDDLPDFPKQNTKVVLAGLAKDSLPATSVHDFRARTVPMQIPARPPDRTSTRKAILHLPSTEVAKEMKPFFTPKSKALETLDVVLKPEPTTVPFFSAKLPEWSSVQKTRKKLLKRKCEEYNLLPEISVYETRSVVHKVKNFLYCPVEKAASTFLRRFMYSYVRSDTTRKIPSPFDIPIQTALTYEFDNLRTLFYLGIYNFVDVSTKFINVREPYSRLFAAYVDKLLVPNTVYWKLWAIPAISRYRDSPSAQSLECGHDVTFVEFVKFVVDYLYAKDEHLSPVRDLCAPCEMDFTLIGHLETFAEDFRYLTSVLNVSFANFTFETLDQDATIDRIAEFTYSTFEFFSDLQSCVTKFEMGQRLWKQMQTKGIISDELEFPLSREKMDGMTASGFVHLLENARRMSRDPEKLRHQRENAIKEAFDAVSAQDILDVVEIYSLDFEMFGYDKYPKFIIDVA